jgi:cation:H+ antiporter
MLPTLLFVAGLGLLALGGELLIRGATALARIAGLSPAVIGLTVVAMGTSLPELAVGLLAALRGQPDIAVGNVIGSNIFNITAALGITTLVATLPVRGNAIRLEWPVMFAASLASALLMRDFLLDRFEASFLLVSLVLFTAYSVWVGRREVTGVEQKEFAAAVEKRSLRPSRREGLAAMTSILAGVALLVGGGHLLVEGAVALARLAGMSERLIGLTIVAVGTGMPELAASLVAAARKQTDVAVANMIGSNVFNLLGILGMTALVHPIRFAPELAGSDVWWMLGTSLLLLLVLRSGMRLVRWEGIVLIAVYVAYLAVLNR